MSLQAVDTEGVPMSDDLQFQRAKRFFNGLRDHAFVAILVDEDADIVKLYTKGVAINQETLRRIREHLDEIEVEMRESDGQDEE